MRHIHGVPSSTGRHVRLLRLTNQGDPHAPIRFPLVAAGVIVDQLAGILVNYAINYVLGIGPLLLLGAPEKRGRNFGRALVLSDKVFGTFRYRAGRNDPRDAGLYGGDRYPARASYLAQVQSMFLPGCCRAAA